MRGLGVAAAALLMGSMTTGCGRQDAANNNTSAAAAAQADSLAATLRGADDLGTMTRMVSSAGLERMLGGVGAYTIFAPVDSAFSALPDDRRKMLESADGRPQLIALLRAHMATGYVSKADLDQGLRDAKGTARLATVAGAPLTLRKQGDAILVGEGDSAARVVGTPIVARNGVIYRIDRIIPPPAGG